MRAAGVVICAATICVASAIRILSPNGGETVGIGDTLTIVWIINADSIGPRGMTIDISVDNGRYWIPVNTTGASLDPGNPDFFRNDTGRFYWRVPLDIEDPNGSSVPAKSNMCLIAIYDPYSEPRQEDISDSSFSIDVLSNTVHSGSAGARAITSRHTTLLHNLSSLYLRQLHGGFVNITGRKISFIPGSR